jgi:hypothetical protein
MEWSRIHSIAQETDLWSSLAIKGWMTVAGLTWIIGRTVHMVLKSGSLMWLIEASQLLSQACVFGSIATLLIGLLYPSALSLTFRLPYIGIGFTAIGYIALSLEVIRRRQLRQNSN